MASTAVHRPASPQTPAQWREAIATRSARIGVMGLGYVGLPLSLVFQRAGFETLGLDTDDSKVARLQAGQSYFRHIGSDAVAAARRAGNFDASTDFSRLRQCDAVIICVPTPLTPTREPDLSFVEATARAIVPNLRAGQLIVLESSTYPGTTEEVVLPILEANGLRCHADAGAERFFLAFSPEREDPGNSQFHTQAIPKLVGGVDADSGDIAHALYAAAFDRAVRVASAKVAEMAKILENTYRCVNIALVNELKLLCQRMDLDIHQVIDAAATKPFGFQAFYPGPGLGGHCIPIDPYYLSWKARQFDFTTRFIELAGEINTEMPYRVVEFIAGALNQCQLPVNGTRILVLGVAYKRDVDDLRESPALKIIDLLRQQGAKVDYHDPWIPSIAPSRHYDFEMQSVDLSPSGLSQYACVVIATDHSAFDYPAIVAGSRLVIDTRNATRGLSAPHLKHC